MLHKSRPKGVKILTLIIRAEVVIPKLYTTLHSVACIRMTNIGDSIYPQLFLMNAKRMRMVDLYSPTQLVQVVNAVDVQKQLNALFTSLFFTRSVMFESRDIILDTIDDPNIPIAAFCSRMVGSIV